MKRILFYIAVISVMLSGCTKTDDFVEFTQYSLETHSKMAKAIVEGTSGYFGHVKNDKVTDLAQGVSLLEMSYLNMKGYSVQLYMYKVILGTASLGVALPSAESNADVPSKLSFNLNNEVTVLGAVNGDIQGADKRASGIVYRNGVAVKNTFSDSKGGFFATLKDGTAVIGEQSDYAALRTSLYNAIGTRDRILTEGYPVTEEKTSNAARSFVAVSQDGMTVWLGVVDGVYFYYSNGISRSDLASLLKAAGAWNAALLNSGDVTTLVKRDDLGDKLFTVINTPSDKGFEKESVNALAIIAN